MRPDSSLDTGDDCPFGGKAFRPVFLNEIHIAQRILVVCDLRHPGLSAFSEVQRLQVGPCFWQEVRQTICSIGIRVYYDDLAAPGKKQTRPAHAYETTADDSNGFELHGASPFTCAESAIGAQADG